MAEFEERAKILNMLEAGQINSDQAARLLEAVRTDRRLEAAPSDLPHMVPDMVEPEPEFSSLELPASDDPDPAPSSTIPPEMRRWRRYWIGVFLAAAGGLILSALWMYWAFEARGYGFWFFCSWLPFLLSAAAAALAWQSRTLPWLHLRVVQASDQWPRRISFSFPLPLGIAGWALRTFGHRIPGLDQTGLEFEETDRLINGLREYTSPDTPLFIEIHEENGEYVLIYIG